MKNYLEKILFLCIFIINMFLLICFLSFKKETFSYQENRYYTEFSLKDINEYVSDHFPFRNSLISIKNHFQKFIGKTYINGIYLGKDNYLISEFVTNSRRDLIVSSINNYTSIIPNTYVLIAPDSILINEDKMYYHTQSSEAEEIEYLYENINATNINIIEDFKKENKNYQLYYKTDHHWTTYGAYYAYKSFCESNNIQYFSLDDFNIHAITNNFLGTSSSSVLGLAKEENIMIFDYENNITVNYVNEGIITDSLYNYDYLDEKDKYSLFLNNNHALIEITNNDISSNESILVVKNSYANSFVPFLVNHYKKVYVIDMRYYNGIVSDFVKENNINETLILYNLNNMYSDMSIIKIK